jgi:outer membrane protein OmpA-like peptidoglycan-associated protein
MYESYEDVALEDYEELEDYEDLGELDPEDFEDLESLEAIEEMGDPEDYEEYEDLEEWEDMGEQFQPSPPSRRRPPVTVLPPITIRVRALMTLRPFAFNSSALSPVVLAKIKRLASIVVAKQRRTRGHVTVRLVGHTDNRGSASYNQALGRRRAAAVARRLRQEMRSISPFLGGRVRIIVQTLGETRPARPNTTPQNRAFNRRVQVFVD